MYANIEWTYCHREKIVQDTRIESWVHGMGSTSISCWRLAWNCWWRGTWKLKVRPFCFFNLREIMVEPLPFWCYGRSKGRASFAHEGRVIMVVLIESQFQPVGRKRTKNAIELVSTRTLEVSCRWVVQKQLYQTSATNQLDQQAKSRPPVRKGRRCLEKRNHRTQYWDEKKRWSKR